MSDDALLRLEAAALKAREFAHTIGERCYTLRIPTRREVRECVHARGLGRSVGDAMLMPLLRHYLLQQCVVGWTGVRARDLVAGGAADPWPWSPGAVALLLDNRPDEADELGRVLMEQADKRNEAIEADAKNSPPTSSEPVAPTWAASPGSASAPMLS
jgi:hypothetical protein